MGVFLGFREEYDACVAHLSTLWLEVCTGL